MSRGRIERGPMGADVVGANFTQIYNDAIRDHRLSWKARGVLTWLLSHKEGFGISVGSLVAGGPEGEKAVYSALRELEALRYLKRVQEQDPETKKFTAMVYRITDIPDGATIHVPSPWAEEAESSRSQPVAQNRKSAKADEGDDVPTSRDRQNRRDASGRAAGAAHKKTTPSEDQGLPAPQEPLKNTTSSPSPLQGESSPAAPDEDEEETAVPPSAGTAPPAGHPLITWETEQYMGEPEEPPAPKVTVDPGRIVDQLPWPRGVQPRGTTRVELCEAVQRLLEASWTRKQIERLIASEVVWSKANYPPKVVLSVLNRQDGQMATTSQEQDIARLEAELAEQRAAIAACPDCNEGGFLEYWKASRDGELRTGGWHGHGDKDLNRLLYRLRNRAEVEQVARWNAETGKSVQDELRRAFRSGS